MHRMHVLEHIVDERHESWCSPDGSVVLLRRQGQTEWQAVVDCVLVIDPVRLNGGRDEADFHLCAGTPQELAQRLAVQERIHTVFTT